MYWFSLYLLQEHIQIYLEDKIFSKPFNLLRQKKRPFGRAQVIYGTEVIRLPLLSSEPDGVGQRFLA